MQATEPLPYRRPFGGEPPETGFSWEKLATAAAGLGSLAAILGSARFGPKQASMYRDWVRQVARVPAQEMPGGAGGEWVKRLLGGSWWHGANEPEKIIQSGFKPDMFPRMGLRFGEPAGVSLTALPYKATEFSSSGTSPIRVWPNVDPKSVLPAWSDEAAEPIMKAYLAALDTPYKQGSTIRDLLRRFAEEQGGHAGQGLRYAANQMASRESDAAQHFNRVLSEKLGGQGIQGLIYNPHRYNEYELRVLDPAKAVTMEMRTLPETPSGLSPFNYDVNPYRKWKRAQPMHRFDARKLDRRIKPWLDQVLYDRQKSLSEIYKNIPHEQIIGSRPHLPAGKTPKEEVRLWMDYFTELGLSPYMAWDKMIQKIPLDAAHHQYVGANYANIISEYKGKASALKKASELPY